MTTNRETGVDELHERTLTDEEERRLREGNWTPEYLESASVRVPDGGNHRWTAACRADVPRWSVPGVPTRNLRGNRPTL